MDSCVPKKTQLLHQCIITIPIAAGSPMTHPPAPCPFSQVDFSHHASFRRSHRRHLTQQLLPFSNPRQASILRPLLASLRILVLP